MVRGLVLGLWLGVCPIDEYTHWDLQHLGPLQALSLTLSVLGIGPCGPSTGHRLDEDAPRPRGAWAAFGSHRNAPEYQNPWGSIRVAASKDGTNGIDPNGIDPTELSEQKQAAPCLSAHVT